MNINPGSSKVVRKFHESSGEGSSKLYFGDQRITEASSCKYLGIILRSDLSWPDQVTYAAQNNNNNNNNNNNYYK